MSTQALGLVPVWERDSVHDGERDSVHDGERDSTVGGRDARVLFVVFTTGELRNDVKLAVDRFGVSSVPNFRALDTREHVRADSPEWFDNWRSGALRSIAKRDLDGKLTDLDAADRCFTIEFTSPDPSDLAHLQSVWALTRFFFARGATVALDVFGMRFLGASQVPEPRASFDIQTEVSLVFETDATAPDGGHVIHTRGMCKFGRPDIVAVCLPAQVDFLTQVIWRIAREMAHGFCPALPRHGVDIAESESWYLVADESNAFASALGLQNDARVLVSADGGHLSTVARA
jgi:hypothetical protein